MRVLAHGTLLLAACTSPAQPAAAVERPATARVRPSPAKELEPPDDTPRITYRASENGPFWARVAGSLEQHFALPSTVSTGAVQACVYFNKDGTVGGTRLLEASGSADLDAAAERALAALHQARRQVPELPPANDAAATTQWNCLALRVAPPP